MEFELPIYKVEIALQKFLIQADFQPRGDLFIFLNDQSYPYFRFDEVDLFTLSSEYQVATIKQPFMAINRRHITFVSILDEESAERLQVIMSKRPVVFYTDWYAIQGNLHVNPDSRDDDLLEQARDFFAVSNASIFPMRSINRAPTRKVPYVLINRHLISAYHPHKPKEG